MDRSAKHGAPGDRNANNPDLSPNIAKLLEKVQKDPHSRLFVPLADEYVKSGLLEEAAQVLTDGLTRHPDFLGAKVELGKVYFQQGKLPEARMELEAVVKVNADNFIALRHLAVIYRRQKLWDRAKQYCETLLAANPKDSEMKQLLQEIETAQGKQDQLEVSISAEELQVTHLSAAEQLQEDSFDPLQTVVDLEVPQAAPEPPAPPAPPEPPKPRTAEPSGLNIHQRDVHQEEASEKDAPEELVSPTLAQLYLRQGHYEQAVRIYDELLRREPTNETYQQAHRMALTLLQGQPAKSQSEEPALQAADSPADPSPGGGVNERSIHRLQSWLARIQQRPRRAS
jgi:tetratricopeptide (TPR) repeat protein